MKGVVGLNVRRTWQTGVWLGVLLGLCIHTQAAKSPLLDFRKLQGVTVRDVLQDSSGSIWLATGGGLWRWVNDEFVAEVHHFHTVNPTECLFETERVLWVGTGDGLIGIDLASMSSLPGPPQLRGVQVRQITGDGSGHVWCATSQGLYRLHLDTQSPTASVVPGTHERKFYSVVADTAGRLWAGSLGVLFSYDGHNLDEHFRDVLAGAEVAGLAVSIDGALWIGLRRPGGLYRLDGETLTRVLPLPDDEAPEINTIIAHPDGEVWIGTERGILRWTGEKFVRIDRDTGLEHDAVLGLYVDREQLVWIATRGGVYQLRSPHVLTYDVFDGLPHPVVQAVLPRSHGEFIVGTPVGLCRMNTAGQVVQRFQYLGSVEVLYAEEDGRLWAGGRNGLVCFDENGGEQRSLAVASRVNLDAVQNLRNITGIGPHKEDGVWVCTTTGLWRVHDDRAVSVSLPAESVEAGIRFNGMFIDPRGAVYLATQTGVLRRDDAGRWSAVPGGREVHCLTTDAKGLLWMGTSQGVMVYEDGFCRSFIRRGSPYGKVSDFTFDHHGTLWLATPQGVSHFDGVRFTTFTESDGLPGQNIHCVEAFTPGVLLVGTSDGLAVLESDRISPSRAPPRVDITDFKAGGEQYVITDAPLRVPNWQRNVSISFQGIGFRQDHKGLRYVSRLLGFEEDWSAPSSEPGRSYTNLPRGNYDFQVKARNSHGMESDEIAALRFSVDPPMWLAPWFLGACLLALSVFSAWILATQRKKRQLQRAAEAATVAKNEFLARVSHEIRTPLTVILGCTEGLDAPRQSKSRAREAIDAIRRNSNHLLGMINDLLDLSKIEAGHLPVKLVPASVFDVLMGVDDIIRVSAEQHGLDFSIVYETDIPERIVTDPGRLRQALINLVSNAIKFTPKGGIRIRVRVEGEVTGRCLVFDVEDTGVGIPPDKMDAIFDAFSQAESLTARKYAGTGLGLAISRSVATRLYGRLTAKSKIGKGSIFTLSIDLSKASVENLGMETRMMSAAELAADRAHALQADAQREHKPDIPVLCGHVLLAEDAPDISNMMRLQLESAGASVTVVDNGSDAVEQAYDEHFDAVIMDIHMPGMDGIAAIKEMRGRGLETPVIVISADSSEERLRECSDAGANGFVPKPFQQVPFLREVARHLPRTPESERNDMADPIRSELDFSSPKMAAAVADFVRTLSERVAGMESALAGKDTEEIARLAHQLKGAGGINGYMCVSEQARQLEEAMDRNDYSAVEACLREFRNLTERISAGLRSDGISTDT